MSRLCRLKTASHGEDGKWAYAEIVRLRAENEALRKDAERWRAYRQYRATPSDDLAPTWNKYLEDSVMMQDCRLGNACDPDKLDAAIDAAMKGE